MKTPEQIDSLIFALREIERYGECQNTRLVCGHAADELERAQEFRQNVATLAHNFCVITTTPKESG